VIGRSVLLDGMVFPEAPRWHQDRLWLSDLHAHRVIAVDVDGKVEVVAQLEDMPSGLGFTPDGSLLVAEVRTQRLLRIDKAGTISLHVDLAQAPDGWINDMVVDQQGRAYVGHNRGRYPRRSSAPGSLVLVLPDRTHRVVADDVHGPNGAVITTDGRMLILAESHADRLTAFDIRPDGALVNRRLFATIHNPDGICLDRDAAVWVACPTSGQFILFKEGSGVIDRIDVFGAWPIACALGGKDACSLFMLIVRSTTAELDRLDRSSADSTSQSRGWIEVGQVERGAPEPSIRAAGPATGSERRSTNDR